LKRLLPVLALLTLRSAGLVVLAAPAGTQASGRVVTTSLTRAIGSLRVAAERQAGHDRAEFWLWVDAHRDCRVTRDEVLAAESLVPARGCDSQAGRWRSYFALLTPIDAMAP
jgi:hypothetical protein